MAMDLLEGLLEVTNEVVLRAEAVGELLDLELGPGLNHRFGLWLELNYRSTSLSP